ncbi:MAG: hypothetical protein ACREUC_18240 [Steroidobacteraceae bacterium]
MIETHSPDLVRPPIVGPRARGAITSLALVGMVLLAAYGFVFVIVQTIQPGNPRDNWLLGVLQAHYAATLGVPMSAAAALCIVLLLETAAGPIQVETPWLTFKGAAAPIILWICCFLAMTFALGWLWTRGTSSLIP